METKHLRLIKTLAEEGGITKSLDKLFLTQSAVSHQLKDLEEQLGTKIFYRGKKPRGKYQWQLTDEGKVLYQTACKVLGEIDNAMATIQELKHGHQGTIRISTECYTTYHWLPSFITFSIPSWTSKLLWRLRTELYKSFWKTNWIWPYLLIP